MAAENEEEKGSRWSMAARMSVEELEEAYGTDVKKGLSVEEAALRLEENGPNELSKLAKRAARPRSRESRYLFWAEVVVRRGGQESLICERDVVEGDLIRVRAGDKVCADIRITSIEGSPLELSVDRSIYTGDANEYEATTEPRVLPPGWRESFAVEKASNLMFRGMLVTRGEALGIVIATGSNTIRSQIMEEKGKSIYKCSVS